MRSAARSPVPSRVRAREFSWPVALWQKLDAVAREISAAGGAVETAQVDALDESAVNKHSDAVAKRAGSID